MDSRNRYCHGSGAGHGRPDPPVRDLELGSGPVRGRRAGFGTPRNRQPRSRRGMLAGKELAFDVEVHEASDGALRLTAVGPWVEMDVNYDVFGLENRARVQASIDVKGKGVMGRFVAKAVEGFLAGGALNGALGQLARAAEKSELNLAGLAQAA